MIAIVLGPDYAVARQHVNAIRADRDPDGTSTSTLDGKSVGIRQVINDIASVGFFSLGRVVIVDDLIARLGKQGSKDAGATPDWPALFAAVPEASTLVLCDPSLATLPAAVKKALPKNTTVLDGQPPRGHDLIAWIQHTAKRAGGSIDAQTARLLATTLYPTSWGAASTNPAFDRPPDMELLANEIEKLVTAAHPNPVSAEDIRNLVDQGVEDKLFGFLDAASAGNLPVALVELNKLLATGEDPAKLLAQLSQNIELGAVVATAGRRDSADIAKGIGADNARRIGAIQRGLQGQSPATVQRKVRLAARSDHRMKTGELRDPLDALHDLILVIAAARQRRPA